MDGDRAVSQHRFRTRGGDGNVVTRLAGQFVAVFVALDELVGRTICQRIFEVPHVAVDFAVLHFEVRNRRLEMGVPVHQPLVAVDQTLFVQRDEGFGNGLDHLVLIVIRVAHGEAFAGPVAGRAKTPELLPDRAAGFLLPVPDPLDERIATHIAAVLAGLGKLTFDDHLRRDPRMVGARLPQHILAAHPLEADQNVLQRVVERVAHVERTGDVRRRDDDGKRFRTGLCASACTESLCLLPFLGNTRLDRGGVVSLVEHGPVPACWRSVSGDKDTARGQVNRPMLWPQMASR